MSIYAACSKCGKVWTPRGAVCRYCRGIGFKIEVEETERREA